MKITKLTAAVNADEYISDRWVDYVKKVAKNVEIDLEDYVTKVDWDMKDDESGEGHLLVTVTFNNGSVQTYDFATWRFAMDPFYLSSDVDIIVSNILRDAKSSGIIEKDEKDAWEFVTSKSVRDSDGFYTEYTLYYNTEEDRYVCIFGDSDLYDPTNTEPDFECEEKWEAFEWFNDYVGPGDDEDDGEDDTIYESVSLADKFIEVHDKDEYNWNLHGTDYEPFYEELKAYMRDGETWDEEDEDGWPADTNVDLKTLFSRMPEDKQKDFMNRFWLNRDEDLDDIESSASGDLSALGRDVDENRMDATDIVKWMYENYPDWAFYDEHELNDGRIQLKFELGPKYQRADLEEDLDEHHVSYVIRNQLNIFAEEDPEYEIESSKEIYDELPEGKYWYFTTHGVQLGSVPKGLIIEEVIDKPEGTYFSANRVISTDALKYYDIKERCPEGEC